MTVLETAAATRRALDQRDAATMGRLIQAYAALARRLRGQIDALADASISEELTRGQLMRDRRYRALLEQVQDELGRYTAFAGVELDAATRASLTAAGTDTRSLVASIVNGDATVMARWNTLPVDTIETLLGFLAPESPLYAKLRGLAPFTAEQVASAIQTGVGLGRNPRRIAASVTQALGQGLSNALRLVRTAQLYAYREASRAGYAANPAIVSGWYWQATLDARTCLSCISKHGTLHPITETLNDHHNGRCAMLPAVRGLPSPIATDGETWFRAQSPAEQLRMMGPGKLAAWQAGRFEFAALAKTHADDVYGPMWTETPLKELVPNG